MAPLGRGMALNGLGRKVLLTGCGGEGPELREFERAAEQGRCVGVD